MHPSAQFSKTRVSQAVAMSLSMLALTPVFAVPSSCLTPTGANTIDSAVTATCYLDTGGSLEVTSLGSINPNGVEAMSVVINHIVNAGTISGGISAGEITNGIINSGTISGLISAVNIASEIPLTITNTGIINGDINISGIDLILNGSGGQINGNIWGGKSSEGVVVNGNVSTSANDIYAYNGININAGGKLHFYNSATLTPVINDGTLAAAAGATLSTHTYTQSATGIFQTSIASDTSYGKLLSTGIVTLPSSAKIDVNVVGSPLLTNGAVMGDVIKAATLNASTFVVTDNSALFNFTATINGNSVDLTTVAANSAPTLTSITSMGNTAGQGAAVVFDSLMTAPGAMAPVITALGSLATDREVSNAVTQTLPLMTGGLTQATLVNLQGINQVIQTRQDGSRGLSSGDAFLDKQAWVKPLGSWADQKDSNGVAGYKAQTAGVAMGADAALSPTYRIGAAFAYMRSTVDGNLGTQNASVNSYQTVLYGSNSLDANTELNWQADYGYNQNKGSRHIAFMNQTALADYTSNSYHIGASLGKFIAINEKTSVIPSFRADYTSIRDNGYTETGAGVLNLIVDGRTTDEFILAVDGKVVHAINDSTTLMANLGVGYDVQASQSSITSSFSGGGAAFTTVGIRPSATLLRGGFGLVIKSSKAVELTARYDIEARTGFNAQTASIKLKIPFWL